MKSRFFQQYVPQFAHVKLACMHTSSVSHPAAPVPCPVVCVSPPTSRPPLPVAATTSQTELRGGGGGEGGREGRGREEEGGKGREEGERRRERRRVGGWDVAGKFQTPLRANP